jgi:hypothetical protein
LGSSSSTLWRWYPNQIGERRKATVCDHAGRGMDHDREVVRLREAPLSTGGKEGSWHPQAASDTRALVNLMIDGVVARWSGSVSTSRASDRCEASVAFLRP